MLKRLFMLLPLIATTTTAVAMPVLSPADPCITPKGVFLNQLTDFFSFRIGFRGDYVYNRKLEDSRHTIDRYSLFANEGVLTLNFFDRIDVYGAVGSVSQMFASKYRTTSNFNIKRKLDTVTIWATGIKALLWQTSWRKQGGTTFLTGSFDYERSNTARPRISTLGISGSETLADGLTNYSYQEMQAALTIGHRVKKLVPYIGVTWNNAIGSLNASSGAGTAVFEGFGSQRHYGYVVGLSLVDVARMTVTAEARFITENAMTIAANFNF